MRRYFKTLAQLCVILAMLAIFSVIKQIREHGPVSPEYIQGALAVPAVFFVAAAILYVKRAKPGGPSD
jgi:lipopolysaccharide export LptBFGC system permease protein LptF